MLRKAGSVISISIAYGKNGLYNLLVLENDTSRLSNLAASWGLVWPAGFESGFGFKAIGFGFGFGFKKKGVDSDSAGFGFEVSGFGSGFGFEKPGFAHH